MGSTASPSARTASRRRRAAPNRKVFVNCPFDDDYLAVLQALVFTVIACGYEPQLAIQVIGSDMRLDKIVKMMAASRLSIHDISRLPNVPGELPRFNMPFECGLFMGLQKSSAAAHKDKDFLILDAQSGQYQKTMSDAAAFDPQFHANDPQKVCECVRHFLGSDLRRLNDPNERLAPGGERIWKHFQQFLAELPRAAAASGPSADELREFNYLGDLIDVMVDWIKANPPMP